MFHLNWVIAVTYLTLEVQGGDRIPSKQTKLYIFETYNLQMFTADKKTVFEVGEGTKQSKITDTQETKKKTSNLACALAEAF